jgi:hypothetical protein
MGKRDSDSGHSPSIANEKGVYDGEAQRAEQVASLERFPDPDEGKSEEERALIVCYTERNGLSKAMMADSAYRTRSLFAAWTL